MPPHSSKTSMHFLSSSQAEKHRYFNAYVPLNTHKAVRLESVAGKRQKSAPVLWVFLQLFSPLGLSAPLSGVEVSACIIAGMGSKEIMGILQGEQRNVAALFPLRSRG